MRLFHTTRAVLLGGLSAGVLDITAAFVWQGLKHHSPRWVLQSVAGGLLGRAAFEGGWETATLGLFLHGFIALVATAVYHAASVRLPLLIRHAVVGGISYGVAVYLFMYGVVLPNSALQFQFWSQSALSILVGLLIHIGCVGLPIALLARWAARASPSPTP